MLLGCYDKSPLLVAGVFEAHMVGAVPRHDVVIYQIFAKVR